MRYLFTIFVLFLLAEMSIAQAPKTAEDWQVFSPESDEFSLETPLTLKQNGETGQKSSRKFFGAINGVYVYVFSDPIKTHYYYSIVLNILPKLGQPGDIITVADAGSKSTSFKDTFGYWHNLTTLRTETRIYVAQTVTLDENNDVASRFIKSFRLNGKPLFVQQPDQPQELKIDESKLAPGSMGGGMGQGSGSGSGTGSGGSGSGSPTPLPTAALTSGIKILSKPRPGYTDFARIYEISGTVMVRVEFLVSGEIGAVTPVTQLPFGLTQQAIAAAKKITFTPAYNDGVPQNVVKQVEYSFSIY